MKKLALAAALVIVAALLGLITFRLASPEIEVRNAGAISIEEVVITLPSNRVVFGTIEPGAGSTIYYSVDQTDGVYQYSINFGDQVSLSATCGYVSSGGYGKRLRLVVHGSQRVECVETNKIY